MLEIPRHQTEEDRYRKIKLLGQGAMGKVYLVQCLSDSKLYVVKRIHTEHLSQIQRQTVEKQAYLLQLFNHPNIIKFKEIYTTKKQKLCIVMQYAEGGDLEQKIQNQQGKHFQQPIILAWLAQIISGLRYIHEKKIIHRDIKGANIFLTKDNLCKIGDFGISKLMNQTMQSNKSFVGTPSYLSPQMVEGKAYSTKADIWALGVILYQLCALKLPFEANSLPVLALRIIRGQFAPLPKNVYSKELQQLIASLLKVDPKKRPSASEIIKNPLLKGYVSHEEIHSIDKSLQQKTTKLQNINKEISKQKSPLRLENNKTVGIHNLQKRDNLRKQMRQDLKKRRQQFKQSSVLQVPKQKPNKNSPEEQTPELSKLNLKPWKLGNKSKNCQIPVQILLPVKKQHLQNERLGSGIQDFTIEIKMSDTTKKKIEEKQKTKNNLNPIITKECDNQSQDKSEDDVEQEIQNCYIDDLSNVRNAIENINLRFAGFQLPQKIVIDQYEDSLDNFQSMGSSKSIPMCMDDSVLKYVSSNSTSASSAQQIRLLLQQQLGYSKFLDSYQRLKQYSQGLVKANKEVQFQRENLRNVLNFLSKQEFESNLEALLMLLVLQNEEVRENFKLDQ